MSDETLTEERSDALRDAAADRPPTGAEEAAADAAASNIDEEELGEIARHSDEMTKLGADVKGEGEIS